MVFHEYAHAWMAVKLGDTTPKAQGRYTLNPAAHIDPIGLLLLLFAHIGWGRPVEINPNNFTSNKSRQFCECLVALAGPVMNFILALVIYIIEYAFITYVKFTAEWQLILLAILDYAVIVNIGLGVFNLLPIPPLDGSKIFRGILPYSAVEWIDRNMQVIYLVFMILWVTGALSIVTTPIINVCYNGYTWLVRGIFSLF
jgi:Zn-dependent protease